MPVLDTAAGPVGYSDRGSGPALVLVHGFLFDKRMWAPQLDSFVSLGYRVVCVDMVGFGDSASTGTVIPMAAHTRAITAVLDALGVEHAVLLGYSMGGQVALDFAATHPHRLIALVLSDTFAGLDAPEGRTGRLALADRLEREGVTEYAEEFLPLVLSPRSLRERPQVADRAREMMSDANPASVAAALRGRAERRDYTDVARDLGVPTLVVVGEEDQFDRGVLGAELAALFPDGRLVTIGRAGHTPSMEASAAFDSAVAEFAGQVVSDSEYGAVSDSDS